MKIKNINIRPKLITMALAGTLATTTLVGCGNYDWIDTKITYNKAIIFDDNTATIIEIEKWKDYDGEQFQIMTKDGAYILTSSYDTKLIDDRKSDISAENLAIAIKGEDVEIIYLDYEVQKQKIK